MQNVDITIIIPTKNEEKNIVSCLLPLIDWAREIIVVDSMSTDKTVEIASNYGASIVPFQYRGGWPKKRQYVLDNFKFKSNWILLLDADEILTNKSKDEIEVAISNEEYSGYHLLFRMEFLGKVLIKSDPGLRKLSLFRVGKGYYEKRFEDQDNSMGDMEVHEHVIVNGKVGVLKEPIIHRNINSLSRFIIKHDEYSNYECKVHTSGENTLIKENFWGSKEQRRRYIKKKLIRNPLAPFFYFLYLYFVKGGFLEGKPGFYYILYQCVYLYFVNSKIYEIEHSNNY
jgi:glycosyltransferase involved in cell wall biosynthesis